MPINQTESKQQRASFPIDAIREYFPVYAREDASVANCFFENAGGTFPAKQVIDHLQHFYLFNKVQPYGANAIQRAAGDAMDNGRRRMAEILNIPQGNLVIGPSTTQNFNTLALACNSFLQAGDEIIVSEQDHEANIGGWLRAAELTQSVVRFWPVETETGQLQLSNLEPLLNSRTRVVSLTHSSNIIGSINPLEDVAELLRSTLKQRTYLVADGVSYAPHGLPDIAALSAAGVDAYCFSTYKTHGPHLGLMFINDELAETLSPQCHYFNKDKSSAYRFDSAGPDHASIAALAGVADYYTQLHTLLGGNDNSSIAEKVQATSRAIKTYEQQLVAPLFEYLRGNNNLRVIGTAENDKNREANIAFISNTLSSKSITEQLAEAGIAAGHGNFYAPRVLQAMGVTDQEDGVVRLSFAHYNSTSEITQLIDALKVICGS